LSIIFYAINFQPILGAITHNVPAVWKLLAQQSESFGGPDKGFAQHRTEGTRPGLAKCGWSEVWEGTAGD
jgi:hypothetical protein